MSESCIAGLKLILPDHFDSFFYILNTVIKITTMEITTAEQTTRVATTTMQPTTSLPETTTQPKTTTSETTTTAEATTTAKTTTIPITTTTESTTNPTTAVETTTTNVETTTTTSAELPVHCCCRCCYDVTSSPVTSSCTVCGDESLADAARCAAQPPPSPTPFIRPTTPNFEAPAQLEGSKFVERLAFNEEFLAKERLTETLASISLSDKIALGFSASEFILDCNYDGTSCKSDA